MVAQQVTWHQMMTALRDEMRRSMREARQAALEWMRRTEDIKKESASLGEGVRVPLGADQIRGDAAKRHAWHALNASYLADVLQAEIALQEFNSRQRLRGAKGVADIAERPNDPQAAGNR